VQVAAFLQETKGQAQQVDAITRSDQWIAALALEQQGQHETAMALAKT